MTKAEIKRRLFEQLPLRVLIMGHEVIFSISKNGSLRTRIGDSSNLNFDKQFERWEYRKPTVTHGPEERSHKKQIQMRAADKEHLMQFLQFFIAEPIGPRLFIFDNENQKFDRFEARVEAVNQAFLTWDAINFWEQKPNGKLIYSVPCMAYRKSLNRVDLRPKRINRDSWDPCMCYSSSATAIGACGRHKEAEKTLFTYYPFFEAEGYEELA